MKKKDRKKFLLEQKRKKFIELMILASDVEGYINAYQAIYPQCRNRNTARTSAYKLLQFPEIKSAIDEGRRKREEELRLAKREEEIRLAKEQVAHEFELDAVLSKIALGKHSRTRKQVVPDKENAKNEKGYIIAEVEEGPTETEMIQAADKLYKRKGSYAPVGIKHEAGDSFLEFIMHAQNLNNNSIPNHVQPGSDK